MDIYQAAIKHFDEVMIGTQWSELTEGFTKMANKKPRGWALPSTACEAVCGDEMQSIPAVVAIGCMQMSIILIDDMLDQDPRGKYNKIGMAESSNLASAYQAAGLLACSIGNTDEEIKLRAQNSLNAMMLKTSYGQALDIQNPQDESAYWNLVKTKSSPFYANSLYIGALYGNAPQNISDEIRRFGALYGEIIQIHDDLGDTMDSPAGPDWLQGRFPLPILFAHIVEHPDKERFDFLREHIQDADALQEAQDILIRCGAISYCLDQLRERYVKMQAMIDKMTLVKSRGLDYLLFEVLSPLKELAKSMGTELPFEVMEVENV